MQTYTHFRCVFDVSSAENLPNAWPALWCLRRNAWGYGLS